MYHFAVSLFHGVIKDVLSFQRCAQTLSHYKTGWIEICLLVIGALIGLLAIIAAFVICCLYRYVHQLLH